MYGTFKQMKLLITEESEKMNYNELCEKYKINLDPIYLATAYVKLHEMIANISHRYFGLTDEDFESYALEKLDQAMQTFDSDKSGFTTYFYILFKNKLRQETQYLNMQKRKANYVSNSYELMVENGFDIESETSVDDQLFSIEELSMREKEYCRLLLLEYTNAEISKIMGVSLTALSYYRTKIKIKWQKLYN